MKRWFLAWLGVILAYAALRYWPLDGSPLVAAITASALVLLGWYAAVGNWRLRSIPLTQSLLAGTAALSCGSLLTLFFLHAPAAFDDVSDTVMEWVATPQQRQTQQVEQQIRQRKTRSGNWLWNEQTIRPLPRRADLKPGNQPEIFLQLEDPTEAPKLLARRAYVSAFALGSYADASWTLTPTTAKQPESFPLRPGKVLHYEVFHPSDPSGQTPLVGLQGLRNAEIAPLSYRGDGVAILPPSDGVIGYRYRAHSQPLSLDDLDDKATTPDRSAVPSAWLQLPEQENLVMALRGLNAENVTTGSLKQKLLQLRSALQQECRYSLAIANPDNRDPLENFLLFEKSGHCELFATAGVMAARALGVPARIAYGWAGGSYYESSNLFVFRAREAHAWTEVLIADVGWVVMDCTPAASIGQSRSAAPGETPIADHEHITEEQQDSFAAHNLTLISSVLGGITLAGGIALAALMIWSRSQRGTSVTGLRGEKAAANYYLAFLRLCRQQQVTVKPHLTIRQLLQKFAPLPAFAQRLQSYHCAIRYGKATPDAATEKSLQQEIQQGQD